MNNIRTSLFTKSPSLVYELRRINDPYEGFMNVYTSLTNHCYYQ